MSDIFGYQRSEKPSTVVSNTLSTISFPDNPDTNASPIGNLVQNWECTYNNNITEIFELGSNKIYWVKGRPTGAGSIGRIIGLNGVKLLPDAAYDVCQGGTLMNISSSLGQCSDQSAFPRDIAGGQEEITIQMKGCIVTTIGFDSNVSDTRINEKISWRFSSLDVLDETGNSSE